MEVIDIAAKKELSGLRFGKLIVIEDSGLRERKTQNGKCKTGVLWRCKCDCGNETLVKTYLLTSGKTQSCGCKKHDSYKGTVAKHNAFNSIRSSAKKRNIEFKLTEDDVLERIVEPCFYCGIESSNVSVNKKVPSEVFKWNGLDRVDPNKGYTKENVVTCCITCNKAKLTMKQDEFYDWIKRVSNHLKLADEIAVL